MSEFPPAPASVPPPTDPAPPTEGERRDPFPFSTEAFLTNREAYTALQGMADANNNLRAIRRLLRTHTDSLHAQVEAELNR